MEGNVCNRLFFNFKKFSCCMYYWLICSWLFDIFEKPAGACKLQSLIFKTEESKTNRCSLFTLLFYQIEPYKNKPFLVLPSSIARNSSAPNAKRIFQIHRGILEGCTNRARPSWPSLKNCQNGTF